VVTALPEEIPAAMELIRRVQFRDPALQRKYEGKKIPMNLLVESYLDQRLDISGDLCELLRNRDQLVNYRVTGDQVRFILSKFLPQLITHSRSMDKTLVTEHYDRGNDFFESFLADTMVYTSAFFKTGGETLEVAQRQKLDYVARKLQLKKGESLLDVGCGWGTLVAHMAEHYGVDATGVTISKNQAEFGRRRIEQKQLQQRARILTIDYRDIAHRTYDKISVLEMAEHVGIKRFQKFMRQLYRMLSDDGVFFLQIAGLRRNWNAEDFTWGTFMAKYIFPGADASLPLSFVVNQLERAGFEIHSVENIGIHYSQTIALWYRNWLANQEKIRSRYGERWFRLWQMFLAWSVLISEQGGSTCFQVVANKNLSRFNRRRWIREPTGLGEFAEAPPAREEAARESACENGSSIETRRARYDK
jgi:cyclopropane fatty-acyl-phospholipid synthase-like methyltransferase